MLPWAIILLVGTLVSALLGFAGLAGAAIATTKPLLAALLLFFLVSLLSGRRAV